MRVRAASEADRKLLQAAIEGDLDLVRELTSKLDHEAISHVVCLQGCSLLHWAAGTNQILIMKFLLGSPPSSGKERNGEHSTDKDDEKITASSYLHMDPNLVVPNKYRKTRGRTPLHYAARNGCFDACRLLVDRYLAKPDITAKDGVTPFQLAVWKNHLDVARYLVTECSVNVHQTNAFGCAAVHWLAISPLLPTVQDTNEGDPTSGRHLIPMATWLAEQGVDFHVRQRQGHTCLHKAAWQGHLDLCRWLHERQGLWDDLVDHAGNYAADLADMANTALHETVARYLRQHCSREKIESLSTLGFATNEGEAQNHTPDPAVLRQAYLSAIRSVHPDRAGGSVDQFVKVQRAYQHLRTHHGYGSQSNQRHTIQLLLACENHHNSNMINGSIKSDNDDEDENGMTFFKTRLIAVVREYGDKGLDVSNVRKKWKQVWPAIDFPYPSKHGDSSTKKKQPGVAQWIRENAGDVVDIRPDDRGSLLIHIR